MKIKIDNQEVEVDLDNVIDSLGKQNYYISNYDLLEEGVNYTIMNDINPENNQKLLPTLVPKEDTDYVGAKIQLTLTTSYHNWNNTIADYIHSRIEQDLEDKEEWTKEEKELDILDYNAEIFKINKYHDCDFLSIEQTLEKMIEIINENNNNI